MKIYYSVINYDDTEFYELETQLAIEETPEWVAEEAADDFFSNHNGWESTWPLSFGLSLDGEKILSKVLVSVENQPCFHGASLHFHVECAEKAETRIIEED